MLNHKHGKFQGWNRPVQVFFTCLPGREKTVKYPEGCGGLPCSLHFLILLQQEEMTLSKLWGGRFTKETNQLVETYTASIGYDQRLAFEDIEGSLAHVQMFGECGILPENDVE